MEEEVIYTLDQLLDAFQSSLDGLDEQLQLLRILDADAAPSWPGMDQAVFALRQVGTFAGRLFDRTRISR